MFGRTQPGRAKRSSEIDLLNSEYVLWFFRWANLTILSGRRGDEEIDMGRRGVRDRDRGHFSCLNWS